MPALSVAIESMVNSSIICIAFTSFGKCLMKEINVENDITIYLLAEENTEKS